jgi:hypothetical protein
VIGSLQSINHKNKTKENQSGMVVKLPLPGADSGARKTLYLIALLLLYIVSIVSACIPAWAQSGRAQCGVAGAAASGVLLKIALISREPALLLSCWWQRSGVSMV